MSSVPHWMKVFHPAKEDGACDEAIAVLEEHPDIGLPSSDSWMARWHDSKERRFEAVMSHDGIASCYGFEEDRDRTGGDDPEVALWIPKDEIDCRMIVRDLQLSTQEAQRLESILASAIKSESIATYAVRDVFSRNTTGIIVFGRDLTFFSDCVALEYLGIAMHRSDEQIHNAALMAAFFEQVSTDLQSALVSMYRAGITPRFGTHVDAVDAKLEENMSERVQLAIDEVFEYDPIPEVDLDLDAFGACFSGREDDKESHILVRHPVAGLQA